MSIEKKHSLENTDTRWTPQKETKWGTKQVEGTLWAPDIAVESEQLSEFLETISDSMREKGLEQDANIVENFIKRLDRYIETIRKNKVKIGQRLGKEADYLDLTYSGNSLHRDLQVNDSIPVAAKVGENGGWIYNEGGFQTDLRPTFEDDGVELKEGEEFINYDFSPEGKSEFYQSLGIIDDDRALEKLLQSQYKKGRLQEFNGINEGNSDDYRTKLPTNVPGMRIKFGEALTYKLRGDSGVKKPATKIEVCFSQTFIENIMKRI